MNFSCTTFNFTPSLYSNTSSDRGSTSHIFHLVELREQNRAQRGQCDGGVALSVPPPFCCTPSHGLAHPALALRLLWPCLGSGPEGTIVSPPQLSSSRWGFPCIDHRWCTGFDEYGASKLTRPKRFHGNPQTTMSAPQTLNDASLSACTYLNHNVQTTVEGSKFHFFDSGA